MLKIENKYVSDWEGCFCSGEGEWQIEEPVISRIRVIAIARQRRYVRPPACITAAPSGWICMKFDIGDFYELLSRKSRCGSNRAKMPDTLHDDLSASYLSRSFE